MKIKLFHKFFLLMFIPGFVSVLWLGFTLIKKYQFSLETPIKQFYIEKTDNLKNQIESQIALLDLIANFIFNNISKVEWTEKQNIIASALNMNRSIKSISAVTLTGEEVIKAINRKEKTIELKKIADKEYFKKSKVERKRVIYIDKKTEDIVVVYPFEKFFLKFEIYKNDFFLSMNFEKIGDTGFSFIVGENGNLLFAPEIFSNIDFSDCEKWEIVQQAIKGGASATIDYKNEKGIDYIGAYSYIPSLNGAVIVMQEKNDAYLYAMDIKKDALRIVIIFVIAVVILSYIFSQNMVKPIMKITKAAQKVSEGDFDQKVEINTNDELKDLADTFNNMTVQLKRYSEMQIERILRERENTQAVLFSTEDGIIMIDKENRIQLINRKAASLLDEIPENLENKNIFEVIKNETIKDSLVELIDKKDPKFFKELTFSSGAATRIFKCTLREIRLPEKKEISGYLIAMYDVTLDKEIEKMKDSFLHSITHDLRNPMGAIKGFVEFMLKEIPGPINETQKKMLISMDRAALRLLGMINNILDIAKMEAGKMDINLSKTSINEIVRRVLDLMESLAQKKRIKFILDASEDIILNIDANLIERVFTNLIGNSIKFTPEDGTITVGLRKEGNVLRAWVEDTGPGIPQDYIDKVFEKFEQVKGQKAGGTGLGLTISKHIVEAHKGKIWAEYRPNKGAMFVFTIPLNLEKDEMGRLVSND